MANTLTITFNSVVEYGDNIDIRVSTSVGTVSILKQTFVNLRQGKYQVTLPDAGSLVKLADAAFNFNTAWNLDYKNFGGTNNLKSSVNGKVVILTFENDAMEFIDASGDLILNGKATYEIDNLVGYTPKEVEFLSFESDVSNPCDNVIANITANGGTEIYNVYKNGSIVLSAVTSPIQLNLLRGSYQLLSISDDSGTSIGSLNLKPPRSFIPNDFDLKVENFTGGATLSIDLKYISSYLIPAKFSLDNITFQDSNVFSGLPDGNYTVYVKDALGCVTSKPIFIDGYTDLTETVFTISDINALHFAKIEGGKKNLRNTLSCNELKRVTYPFYHRFLADDVITTQLKTNAAYLNIYTIDSEGKTNELSAVQESENTNLQAKSTATYFD